MFGRSELQNESVKLLSTWPCELHDNVKLFEFNKKNFNRKQQTHRWMNLKTVTLKLCVKNNMSLVYLN